MNKTPLNFFLVKCYRSFIDRIQRIKTMHDSIMVRYQVWKGYISIGTYTYGIKANTVSGACLDWPVRIGSYCSIAPNVSILVGVDHPLGLPSTYPFKTLLFNEEAEVSEYYRPNLDVVSKGPVTIGSDVWIGQGATILSGVTIGHGCVIGAGAIVTRDLAPYSIAVGIPCRVIGKRFRDDIIERLLNSRWWELPFSDLERVREYLYKTDINEFLDVIDIMHSKAS